ncbi:50S ribosomal protein L6 [Candidatus Wolfebacteria bacterium]|nr:50S ribosomal protein L6 [Candidatus Wolfebacteria bacterium]
MSKIGKKPIIIPSAVTVKPIDGAFLCTGPLGSVTIESRQEVDVTIANNVITFKPQSDSRQARASWGTSRALFANAIFGVTNGFKRTLLIEGVGYRAAMDDSVLTMHLGYSHPVRFDVPAGITVAVAKNIITVSGIDKQLVGETAARIRALKKPEPYKGKGIRYENEVIRRKAGKKTAGATK